MLINPRLRIGRAEVITVIMFCLVLFSFVFLFLLICVYIHTGFPGRPAY